MQPAHISFLFDDVGSNDLPIIGNMIPFFRGIELFFNYFRKPFCVLFFTIQYAAFQGEREFLYAGHGDHLRHYRCQVCLRDLVHIFSAFGSADHKCLLIKAIYRLIEKGHTIVIIEHNPEVILAADHEKDLGPEGGNEGGNIVATGTPEDIMNCADSHTGRCLKELVETATII